MDRAQQILSKTELPPVFGSNAPGVVIQAYKPGEVTWILACGPTARRASRAS